MNNPLTDKLSTKKPDVAAEKTPLAILHGKAVIEQPADLYIPPDALEIVLETFEGPLDLLLYLIKKHKLDILQLSVHTITKQYMQYIALMKDLKLELAAEYLVMAALLTQIKSRLLLPVHKELEEQEVDPRVELVRRLQEYEQFKIAAENLDELPRVEREIFIARATVAPTDKPIKILPQVSLQDLVLSLSDIMVRVKQQVSHEITAESLSMKERMVAILQRLQYETEHVAFSDLFNLQEGKNGVVVTFIAILELIKESLIDCVQLTPESKIYIKLIK